MEEVVLAVRALHNATNVEERRKADQWLRCWQLTPAAWDTANQLLAEPGVEFEVQLTAAITLRTKLLFDFVQLPETAHESLCSSLLGHIERFKDPAARAILETLSLAFADLAIHTSRAWPTFLDVLHSKLSSPSDVSALLFCLKALPQEFSNTTILAEPRNFEAYGLALFSRIPWVASKLEGLLQDAQLQAAGSIAVRVLDCVVQWAEFCSEMCAWTLSPHKQKEGVAWEAASALFPEFVVDMCFKLVSCADPSVSDAAIECLEKALRVATQRSTHNQKLIDRALNEIAAPEGCVRQALVTALESDDAETTLRVARIYRFTCSASREKLATLLWQGDPVVKDLLAIVMRLTAVSFDLEDEARGSNGIAATMLHFWERLLLKLTQQRRLVEETGLANGEPSVTSNAVSRSIGGFNSMNGRLVEGSTAESAKGPPSGVLSNVGPSQTCSKSGANDADQRVLQLDFLLNPHDTNAVVRALADQDILLQLLLQTLLNQCLLPAPLFSGDSCVSGNEFYRFRRAVCDTIQHLRYPLGFRTLLMNVLQSLMLTTSTHLTLGDAQRAQEAHFACLAQLFQEAPGPFDFLSPISTEKDSAAAASAVQEPQQNDCARCLFQLLSDMSALLSPSAPQTLLDCLTRTAAADFVLEVAHGIPNFDRWLGVTHLMEALMRQIVGVDCEASPPESSTGQDFIAEIVAPKAEDRDASHRDDIVTLKGAQRFLEEVSADALRVICINSEVQTVTEFTLRHMFSALVNRPQLRPAAYGSLLDGVATIINFLPEDQSFLLWSIELLTLHRTQLVAAKSAADSCIPLDRLAQAFRLLSPTATQTARKEALATFLGTQIWPLLEHMLRTYTDSSTLVERCLRIMKHAMRCIQGDMFKPLVPSVVQTVVTNAKIVMHPTYLYVAEWLVAEYAEDSEMRGTLEVLFEELSFLGFQKLQAAHKEGKLDQEGNLIEDCFGMQCRFFRFCPTVPGRSKTLPDVLEMVYPCLHHSSLGASQMALTFVESLAYIVRTCECEEGAILSDFEATQHTQKRVEELLYHHLSRLIVELFRVIIDVPQAQLVHDMGRLIQELRKGVQLSALRTAVNEGLHQLPPEVVLSEDFRKTLLTDIVEGDQHDALRDISDRCRRIGLRKRQAKDLACPTPA